jgi:hypothetical protein
MEHPEITFNEDGEVVSIWVGSFGRQEAVDAYTAEQYDEDREDEPLSEFAADIGLKRYDHDFIEVHFEEKLSQKGEAAFAAHHSYGESFAAAASAAIKESVGEEFDTMLLLYGYDHRRYPQARKLPQRVRFVSTFPYRVEHPEWFQHLMRDE